MHSLVNRPYGFLAEVGVHVHTVGQWNVTIDPYHFSYYYPLPHVRYHTTQDRVWIDGVEAKKQRILGGYRPEVTVTNASEYGDRDLWITNGHHTLAAYLLLRKQPYLRWFARSRDGYHVNPPQFYPTARL